MRFLLAILILASPACAKDIALPLTDQEQQALIQILDNHTKFSGIAGAEVAVHFMRKLSDAQKPVPPPAPEPKQ